MIQTSDGGSLNRHGGRFAGIVLRSQCRKGPENHGKIMGFWELKGGCCDSHLRCAYIKPGNEFQRAANNSLICYPPSRRGRSVPASSASMIAGNEISKMYNRQPHQSDRTVFRISSQWDRSMADFGSACSIWNRLTEWGTLS